MEIKIIYEDKDVMVVEKPAGVVVFCEASAESLVKEDGRIYLIDELIKMQPELKLVGESPRYGIVHRLDKDTSGILLVAKNADALFFLQKELFTHTAMAIESNNDSPLEKNVEKRYITLVSGNVKEDQAEIRTLIGRAKNDPRKQRVFRTGETKALGKREAITEYKVLERFENYTLLEIEIKTGRKHQIRCHLNFIHHPIAGDALYGFKGAIIPKGLVRQFLHAGYLKIKLPNGEIKEFKSDLPSDLQKVLDNLKI